MRNSVSNAVKMKIEKGGPDRLWTYADFESLPAMAVAASLTRLVKKGLLRRVRNGVYYKPRETRFGVTSPDCSRVAAAVLDRRGIAWRPSGLPVYNALGLTTQVSPVATFDVDRDVTSLRTNLGGRVRYRSVAAVKKMRPEERAVLDALRDLRSIPDTPADVVLHRITDMFRSGRLSFGRMVKAADKEPPRVKALLGTIGTVLGEDAGALKPLRESLNSTTTFKLGLGESIPAARGWGIR